ncbi:MAG: FUSC family protein, partial [Clostridium sp.]|nr:FUSC family protein [Clostridium sp.]
MKNNYLNKIKKLLAKLPVFIFCVIFIKGYTTLFGQENSIAGVVLLVGLLMFMEGNLGFKTRQASISIIIMFGIIMISPKLSLINPYLGIIINFASIFTILSLCSANPNANNQLTFMLGYIFFQGYDVTGLVYEKRVISIIIGAVIISFLYYLINSKKESDMNVVDVLL